MSKKQKSTTLAGTTPLTDSDVISKAREINKQIGDLLTMQNQDTKTFRTIADGRGESIRQLREELTRLLAAQS